MDKVKDVLGLSSHLSQSTSSTANTNTTTTSNTSSSTAPPTANQSPTLPDLPEHAVFNNSRVTVIFVLGGPGAGTPLDDTLHATR